MLFNWFVVKQIYKQPNQPLFDARILLLCSCYTGWKISLQDLH